jgi:serine/threonine protein kinase
MTDTGVVKLSDFGVAKILTDVEDCRSTSGTHGYMVSCCRWFQLAGPPLFTGWAASLQAPEVYMGAHQHGTASEWFSAGVTVHELLTGRRPFEASRLQAFRYCKAFPGGVSYAEQQQYAYCEDPYLSRSCSVNRGSPAPATPQLVDALWPDYLYSQSCATLSAECRSFVRELMIPDVSYHTIAGLPAHSNASFICEGHCPSGKQRAGPDPAAPLAERHRLGAAGERRSARPASEQSPVAGVSHRTACPHPLGTSTGQTGQRTVLTPAVVFTWPWRWCWSGLRRGSSG